MLSIKRLCASLLAATALLSATPALAGNDITYRFSGFGTVGYTALSTDDVLLTYPGQLKGAQSGGTGLIDSRIGGQVNIGFSSDWSATVQAIAKQDAEGKFMPQLEWAFVRYQASRHVAVRVGRLGWPAYLVSDYRYVGYATPWTSAPMEVYKLAPLDYFEGADATWSSDVGSGYLSVNVLGGHASVAMPDNDQHTARLKVNQLTGAYVTYEIGNWRLRGGLSTGKVSYTPSAAATLLAGLQLAGFGNVAGDIRADNSRTTFYSLGGVYNGDALQVTAEYARLDSDAELLGTASGWYATAGYRLGKWVPYVTEAGYDKQNHSGKYGIPAVGPLLPLVVGVNQITGADSQDSTALGLRFNATSNLAIKAQVEQVRPSAQGGWFSVKNPAYDGDSVNVYSVVADFVF